ncbi:TetR/AcrR family transcriptional regulator [Caballeronia sp. LZ008]|uniref:TetR/AcrR family transcriptional regulator n=1 Tax=Caballeronia sp. LZ008 TaxID=3038560 RepID=UPI00285CAC69|nr:TetR/AcrR family transcriptional regulator [Caballeronia sp. LZ008]MDR5798098.1 TetR/AcrR family transcriptional regulator [Caballeronia sp. LZ008]
MPREEVVLQADDSALKGMVIGEGERFDELLNAKSRDRALPKRDRTRCAVMSCVARQLLVDPGRHPAIETILDETGLSRGTFYNYFDDIDMAIEAVLVGFFNALWSPPTTRRGKNAAKHKDAVYAANLWYCQAYETNAGLFAAFSHVSAYTPSLVRMREQMNAVWVERVTEAVSRDHDVKFSASMRRDFRGALRLLIAMSIEALRERHVHQDQLLTSSFENAHELAAGLTTVWTDVIDAYVARAKSNGNGS